MFSAMDQQFMRRALFLARRALGCTSPNPLVGAVLVKRGKIIGEGWHHAAGQPHAEIEAFSDAARKGHRPKGATLYVTLEPCCTQGRTPPCTNAILFHGIKRVVVAATDPNPAHAGKGFQILRAAGLKVETGCLGEMATELNAGFNHWITQRTSLVTLKAAMTLDGKIATKTGESKWITGEASRAFAMKLRRSMDAILVGVNTILQDNPSLTLRPSRKPGLRRIVLDPRGRIPANAKVITDELASLTTIVTTRRHLKTLSQRLPKGTNVLPIPLKGGKLDLTALLKHLGQTGITNLLVEGGGETNWHFLKQRLVHRVVLFYAPLVIGGRDAVRGIAGEGFGGLAEIPSLQNLRFNRLDQDLALLASVCYPKP